MQATHKPEPGTEEPVIVYRCRVDDGRLVLKMSELNDHDIEMYDEVMVVLHDLNGEWSEDLGERKIRSRGRVTIPKEVRERRRIHDGDRFHVSVAKSPTLLGELETTYRQMIERHEDLQDLADEVKAELTDLQEDPDADDHAVQEKRVRLEGIRGAADEAIQHIRLVEDLLNRWMGEDGGDGDA